MIDLIALFDTLAPPADPAVASGLLFATAALPGWPMYHVGRTALGEAALLIETQSEKGRSPPPMRLRSLAVYHDALCRVDTGHGTIEERVFTVVWHTEPDPTIRRYFLGMVAPFVMSLGKQPSSARVFEAVDALADLFRTLARAPKQSTQGLWAELLLIAEAKEPVALAEVWHEDPDDRFDFNAGAQRLEVKSAIGTRRHHFALAQLHEPAGTEVVIASVLTARATGGTSLETLLHRVHDRLANAPALQAHVYRVVAETLGSNLSAGLQDAFDEQLGRESFLLFRACDIPTVPTPLPAAVSEVHFLADLSAIEPLHHDALASKGGMFASLAS